MFLVFKLTGMTWPSLASSRSYEDKLPSTWEKASLMPTGSGRHSLVVTGLSTTDTHTWIRLSVTGHVLNSFNTSPAEIISVSCFRDNRLK